MPIREREYNPNNDGEEGLEELGEDYLDTLFEPRRGRKDAPLMGPMNITARRWGRGEVVKHPERHHAERSAASRTADESFNAPMAPTYAAWKRQPNRLDYPLVDTIPPERIQARADDYASRALEAGIITEVETMEEVPGGWGGLYTGGDKRVQTLEPWESSRTTPGTDTYGHLLAHEVGHGVDFEAGRKDKERHGSGAYTPVSERAAGSYQVSQAEERIGSGALVNPFAESDEDLHIGPEELDELWQISQRARGRSYSDYRRRLKEVTADALAQRELEPRAIRRDYPRAASWLDKVDRLAFSDLEADA